MNEIPEVVYTHGGRFHADDVLSTALLKLLRPGLEVRRVFNLPAGPVFAYDIGGGPFDHHQAGAEVRPNGVPYAAFGLLWREYGTRLVSEAEAKRFDEKFIQHIDKDDNTGCGDVIADLVGGFNPLWDSDKSEDQCFAAAVEFVTVILNNRFAAIRATARAKTLVEQAYAEREDGIVRLPCFAPWKQVLVPSEAIFVVYPSQRGGYSAQCVPNDDAKQTLKIPFPAAWAGERDVELRRISGLSTLRFCHKSCFMVAADTLEDALGACHAAMAAANLPR